MNSATKPLVALCSTVAVSAVLLAGCSSSGSSSSDQPAYCAQVSTLADSVSQLGDISLDAGALDTARTNLETVQTNAQAAIDAAKNDFPSETSDLSDSIDTASKAVKDLPSSPSASDIAAVALDVSAVVNSAQSFQEATSSACN